MVPRQPGEAEEHEHRSSSESGEDQFESFSSASEPMEQAVVDQESPEQEFHTGESAGSSEEDEIDSESEVLEDAGPLLPKELLKPLPSPAHSLQQPVNIPWEQMTRQQRVAQRNRSRKSKKRAWDKLKRNTQGTGVLEAGKVAQVKRGFVSQKEKVKTGRVAKKTKTTPKVSGRQQLLEHRKRAVEQSKNSLLRPPKTEQRRRRKRASAG